MKGIFATLRIGYILDQKQKPLTLTWLFVESTKQRTVYATGVEPGEGQKEHLPLPKNNFPPEQLLLAVKGVHIVCLKIEVNHLNLEKSVNYHFHVVENLFLGTNI